jgi:hypothetical protein
MCYNDCLMIPHTLEYAKNWIQRNPWSFGAAVVAAIGAIAVATIFHSDFTQFVEANPLVFGCAVLAGALLPFLVAKVIDPTKAKKTHIFILGLLGVLVVAGCILHHTPVYSGYMAALVGGFAVGYTMRHVLSRPKDTEEVTEPAKATAEPAKIEENAAAEDLMREALAISKGVCDLEAE